MEQHTSIASRIYILLSLMQMMSLIVGTAGLGANMKTWSYELKSIRSQSSDPAKVKIDLDIERVSRGVYAISGELLINVDVVEGDSNKVAAKSFRSAQGDGNYNILPFQVPETHIFKALNNYYKNLFMDTLKTCSNMPVFENQFQPPLEKKIYKLNACQFSQDGLPNHLQDGMYKLLLIGTGEVEWEFEVIAEVTPNM